MNCRKPSFESQRFSIYLASRDEIYSDRYLKIVEKIINELDTSPKLLAIIVIHEYINPCFAVMQEKAFDALTARKEVKHALLLICMHGKAEYALMALWALEQEYAVTAENLLDLSLFAVSLQVRYQTNRLRSIAQSPIRRAA